jgi:hypothetical protein
MSFTTIATNYIASSPTTATISVTAYTAIVTLL